MAHFAKIEDNIVVSVIVAEQSFIDTLPDKDSWLQTSYKTIGGKNINGKEQLRKNFAGIGFTYDSVRDAFIAPKPFDSWLLNEDTCIWECPIPYPDDGKDYVWDEKRMKWVKYTPN